MTMSNFLNENTLYLLFFPLSSLPPSSLPSPSHSCSANARARAALLLRPPASDLAARRCRAAAAGTAARATRARRPCQRDRRLGQGKRHRQRHGPARRRGGHRQAWLPCASWLPPSPVMSARAPYGGRGRGLGCHLRLRVAGRAGTRRHHRPARPATTTILGTVEPSVPSYLWVSGGGGAKRAVRLNLGVGRRGCGGRGSPGPPGQEASLALGSAPPVHHGRTGERWEGKKEEENKKKD
ncbi:unnamed protein product [Urochloa humidicola]